MPNKAQYAKRFPRGYAGPKVTLEGKRVFVWPGKNETDVARWVQTRTGNYPKFLVKRHHPTKEAAKDDFEHVCNAVLLGVLPPNLGRAQPGDSRKEGRDG